ncbi:unnamed protein product [Oikopleura dioica]|uniref:Cilia- and flagella-associated protein 58 central coiled coil domain-containing protein n=1 Tax=Oikopleura dioica TaxID=34765 RepID=E4XRM5_OIKDI|nr:unnamed protein product [Oikopleura dioica]
MGGETNLPTDESELVSLEKDFQEVIGELTDDPKLTRFRIEYEKIHDALKRILEANGRLQRQNRELNAEIVSNSAKVAQVTKICQDDQANIERLNAELEKAWKLVDGAHEKEHRARETIKQLEREIQNLTDLIESGKLSNTSNFKEETELIGRRDGERKTNAELLEELTQVREQLNAADENYARIQKEHLEAQEAAVDMRDQLFKKQNDITQEQKRGDVIQRDLDKTREDVKNQEKKVKSLENDLADKRVQMADTERQTRDFRIECDKKTKENRLLEERIHNLKSKIDSIAHENEKAAQEVNDGKKELSMKAIEIRELNSELKKIKTQRELAEKKLKSMEESRASLEDQKENLKRETVRLEQDTETARIQADFDKKEIEKLTRERDLISKTLQKASSQTQKQVNLVKLHEQQKANLENEIQQFRDEAAKQRKLIYALEKERDKYINEASEKSQQVLQYLDEVKEKEMSIFDLKKEIAMGDTKLKQQTNLYEACRADRNLYSKNLVEANDEILEMKRKQDFLKNQIDQLKYEINAKENAHHDVTKAINKMQKEKDDLKAFIAQIKERYSKSEEQLKDHEKEIARQQTAIREAEADRKKQKNALDQVVTERDILVRQLFRRNDELSLVYEKIKLQQATMSKGELQYKQRLEDVRVLKLEIRKQQREKTILKNTLSNADELRREIFNTQKELLKERTKCRALAEELENPLNIHRWRRLEGSDPASFELIQKVQALQKRLIEKNEEVVKTDMMIQEKEKMYVELREILARQPGPEVVEQLAEFKHALRHKTKQLKRLAAELNMSESQQEQQEMEIHKIARELQEIKQKYLSAKKREHARREAEMDHSQRTHEVMVDRPVITGGGFHLKNTVTT